MPRDETFTIAASRMLVRILCGRSCLLMAELIDLQHYLFMMYPRESMMQHDKEWRSAIYECKRALKCLFLHRKDANVCGINIGADLNLQLRI